MTRKQGFTGARGGSAGPVRACALEALQSSAPRPGEGSSVHWKSAVLAGPGAGASQRPLRVSRSSEGGREGGAAVLGRGGTGL